MEKTLWEAIAAPRAAGAGLRLGHLWRRRLDARAHPRDGRAHRRETELKPAAHLTCVGASRARSTPSFATIAAAGVRHIVALRGDSAGRRRRALCRPSRGLSAHRGSRRRDQAQRRFRGLGLRLSRKASAEPEPAARHRGAEAQGRRGRRPRDHPVLLRQHRLLSLSRRRRGGGHQHSDRAGHRAGAEFQADRGLCASARARACRPGSPSASRASTTTSTTRRLVAAAVCAEQVIDLIDRGVTQLHFYTMNRADLVFAICHLIGLRPRDATAKRSLELATPLAR